MIDKKLQDKWEKKLQKLGLGVYQPMTDNSEGELAEVDSMSSNTKNPDHARLRTMMDGSDQFLNGGFEIKSVRTIDREIPEWAVNDKEVQRILKTAFPKLSLKHPTSKKEKVEFKKRIAKAGRWARIIYLYYRMELPRQIVAKEMGLSEPSIKSALQHINNVAKGLTARGNKRSATPPTPLEVTGERGDETK